MILFFGFIRDYKGLDILIESMKELNHEYLLLIAGEVYGDFRKYDEMIDKYDLRSRINLQVRYIPETGIPVFFSAADVCILPYRSATQSGIVGIAYHFDLPVIVTNVGGLAEMVEENKTGLIANVPDAIELASTLKKFFLDRTGNDFIAGITKFKSEHSWKSLADDMNSFTKKL